MNGNESRGQISHGFVQIVTYKVARPVTGAALVIKDPANRGHGAPTDRTEYRPLVPAFRFAFEQCPPVLDKLFRYKHLCLGLFQFAHALSKFGVLLLKFKCALTHSFDLFLHQGRPLPKYLIEGQAAEEVQE